jgi:hypothetical protein
LCHFEVICCSILRAENEDNIFFWNVGTYQKNSMVSNNKKDYDRRVLYYPQGNANAVFLSWAACSYTAVHELPILGVYSLVLAVELYHKPAKPLLIFTTYFILTPCTVLENAFFSWGFRSKIACRPYISHLPHEVTNY